MAFIASCVFASVTGPMLLPIARSSCAALLVLLFLLCSLLCRCVLAPAFAYIFLGQTISLADGVGGGIIITGLVLTVIAKYREAYSAAVVEVEVEGAVEGSIVVEKDGMLHLLAPDGSAASVDIASAAAAGKAGELAPATSMAPPTSIASAVAGAGGGMGMGGFAVLGNASANGDPSALDAGGSSSSASAGLLPPPSPGLGATTFSAATVPPSPLLGGGALPGSATPRFRRKVRAASRIFLDDAGPLGEDEDNIPVTSLWVGPAPGPLGAQARALGAGALARRGALAGSVGGTSASSSGGDVNSSGGAAPGLVRHGSGGGSGSATGDFGSSSSGGLLHARIPIRNVRTSGATSSGGSGVSAAASVAAARTSLLASSLGGFPLAGVFGSAPNMGQGASLMAAHAAVGGSAVAGRLGEAAGASKHASSASIAIRRGQVSAHHDAPGRSSATGGADVNLDSVLAASLPERMSGNGGIAGFPLGSSAPLSSAMPPHATPRGRIESADASAPLMGSQHGLATGDDVA